MIQPYGIHTIDSQDLRFSRHSPLPLHRHQQTAELVWVESGTAEVTLVDQRLELSVGEMLLIPTGCWHRFDRVDGRIRTLICPSAAKIPTVQLVKAESPQFVASLFTELERDIQSAATTVGKCRKMVELLWMEFGIMQLLESDLPTESFRLLHLLHELEETCHLSFSLSDTAARFGLSKFHFSRLFKECCKETPLQFVISCRMDCAQQLLRATGEDVASIAAQCGYKSATQFHAAFTRHSSMTPRRYRLQQRDGL
ncbi:AraC family transcriptional regulator [Planococcus maritimus]|nr:AraC family transcriptional regulator [Planococcus sp. SK3692]MDE4083499.1 AraC family transcriptional regulator [Planococcus maritimus]